MAFSEIILFTGWGAVCTVWLGLIVAQRRARRSGLFLQVGDRGLAASTESAESGKLMELVDCDDFPSVCVVIAARNESAGLAKCVQHILAQEYPPLNTPSLGWHAHARVGMYWESVGPCPRERGHGSRMATRFEEPPSALSVLVIDDRSEDDTYAIAQKLAQSDPRVQVRPIDELPPNWMGKSHALWQGTRGLRADWLLFMDADCTLKPRALQRAMEEVRDRQADLLTLWPQHDARSFWEQAAIPLCGGIIALWFGSGRVNDPGSELAFANGQFLLIRRQAYDRIGGHKAVRRALIEDIPLAEHAKHSGLVCRVASGRDLVSVRMYDSYEAIVQGWARIFVGALRSGTKIALSILWLIVGSLLPYVVVVALAVTFYKAWSTGTEVSSYQLGLALMCVNHLALMMIASYRFWGLGGCRRIDLLWYPLSVCVVIRILLQSWWWLMVAHRVAWRDTYYTIDRKGRIVG